MSVLLVVGSNGSHFDAGGSNQGITAEARVLVTGGAGAVGSNIVYQLLERGAPEILALDNFVRGRRRNLSAAELTGRVRVVSGDVRDPALLRELTDGVDLVFHQAAIRTDQCVEDPRLAIEVLADGTFNVIDAAARSGVSKLIAASSTAIGWPPGEPASPERPSPWTDCTLYGATKAFNEGLLRSYHEMAALDYVALRYTNVYGPRMDVYGAHTETLIRWIERIAVGEPPVIPGDGERTMDLVCTPDVARANLLAAEGGATNAAFDIATGVETSLNELAELLLDVMSSDLPVERRPELAADDLPRRLADTATAREGLGFEAEIKLRDGLGQLVEWWRSTRAQRPAPTPVASAVV